MKKVYLTFIAALLLAGSALTATAQDNPLQMKFLSDDLERSITEKMPGWRREPVRPPGVSKESDGPDYDSEDEVVIDQWTSSDKVVKVAILQHRSQEEAIKVLRKFTSEFKTIRPIKNQGDEGYAWDVRGSVAFRKGNLTIYVSAVAIDTTEEAALSTKFARLVAEALIHHN